jgi:hypothetical protein
VAHGRRGAEQSGQRSIRSASARPAATTSTTSIIVHPVTFTPGHHDRQGAARVAPWPTTDRPHKTNAARDTSGTSPTVGLAFVSGEALLLVLGFILWLGGKGSILGPIESVIAAIAFTVWFVTAYGAVLLMGGTAAGVAYLWHVGRTRTAAPTWFAPPAKPGEVVNLTPSIVVAALRDLGIKVLRDAIKADPDMGARMLGPIARYGDVGSGTSCPFLLPRWHVPGAGIGERGSPAGRVPATAASTVGALLDAVALAADVVVADVGEAPGAGPPTECPQPVAASAPAINKAVMHAIGDGAPGELIGADPFSPGGAEDDTTRRRLWDSGSLSS